MVHEQTGTAGTAMATGACRSLDYPALVADLRRIPVPNRRVDADRSLDGVPDPQVVSGALTDLILGAGLTGSGLIVAGAELAVDRLWELQHAPMPVIGISQTAVEPFVDKQPSAVGRGPTTDNGRADRTYGDLVGRHGGAPVNCRPASTPEQMWQVGARLAAKPRCWRTWPGALAT